MTQELSCCDQPKITDFSDKYRICQNCNTVKFFSHLNKEDLNVFTEIQKNLGLQYKTIRELFTQINWLNEQLKKSEHDRFIRLQTITHLTNELQSLQQLYHESEKDRAARLEIINRNHEEFLKLQHLYQESIANQVIKDKTINVLFLNPLRKIYRLGKKLLVKNST